MYVEDLIALRDQQVERRRQAARDKNVAEVLAAQESIDVIDRALVDERRLAELP